jgi:circadian clock protein KaiB
VTAPHPPTPTAGDDDLDGPRRAYELTLFVSGASDLSARAVADARELCDTYLDRAARLTVVDVYNDPRPAQGDGVLATPTLVRTFPLPARKIIGDLSDTARVLLALDLRGSDAGAELG